LNVVPYLARLDSNKLILNRSLKNTASIVSGFQFTTSEQIALPPIDLKFKEHDLFAELRSTALNSQTVNALAVHSNLILRTLLYKILMLNYPG